MIFKRTPKKSSHFAFITLLLCLHIYAPNATCIQDPHLKWKTITTAHFKITYHSGLDEVAKRLARAAEEARRRVVLFLGYEPKQKVEVVLVDNTDSANGYAFPLYYNSIGAYATAPADLSVLEDFDDWLLALMVHEYTHIVHLDNWGGIVTVLNHIFGKTLLPNGAQPLWIIEGYAVFEESTKTSGGRLHSSIWDMYMRMATLENNLLPIDTISTGTILWPHGAVAYLYGSHFLKWLTDRYGQQILWRYSEDYGNNWIPFGINREIKKATGKTWVALYREFKNYLKDKYEKQAEAVLSEGLREGVRITFTGEIDRSPRYSPDGKKIVFFSSDGHDRSGIYIIDLEQPRKALEEFLHSGKLTTECDRSRWKESKIIEITGQGSVVWTPDGQGLIYSRSEVWKNWYHFHDLYYLSLKDKKKPMRLTYGARARQPDISPDGEKLLYTINRAGSSKLFISDSILSPQRGKVLDCPATEFTQSYSPRFSPDGEKIAYSIWTPGGGRNIRIIELKSGKAYQITNDRHMNKSPVWDPDGKYLFFTSDRTGIYNIYAYEFKTSKLYKVTNVVGGTFMPDISPDGKEMIYVGYTSRGYDLYLMKLDKANWEPIGTIRTSTSSGSSHSKENLHKTRKRQKADLSWADRPVELSTKRYNPIITLLPRHWEFRIQEDGFGQSMSLLTSATDITSQHTISATLHFGLEGRRRIGYSFNYGFLKLPINIYFSHSRRVSLQGGYRVDDQWKRWLELGYRTALSLSLPIRRADFTHSFGVTYRLTYMSSGEKLKSPVDPNAAMAVLPDRGFLSGFTLSYRFSNIHGSTYGFAPEQGGSMWTSLGFDLPALGSDYTTVSITYGASGYIEMPYLQHHVVALRFSGGYGSSTFSRKGIFVIGGFPEEQILKDLFNRVRMWSVALRGYPPAAAWGDQFYLFNFEYRFPLFNIYRGISTLPWELGRIYMSIFSDTGGAWWANHFDIDGIKTGAGAELFLTMGFGYYEWATFRIGYGYGFMEGGGHQFYVVLSSPF